MDNLTPYRLTIVGGLLVVVLSVALVIVLGGPSNAAPYITFAGTIAIPALLTLYKAESNAKNTTALHIENQNKLQELQAEITNK